MGVASNALEALDLIGTSTAQCLQCAGAVPMRGVRFLLGVNDHAAEPRNTGAWCVMTLKPYAAAQASLGAGPVDIENAREYMWMGEGAWIMHNLLHDGQLVQFVVAAYEKDAEGSDRRHRAVGADEIKRLFEGFPAHLVRAVDEASLLPLISSCIPVNIDQLLCDQPQQPAMYLWDHPPARTYVSESGSVCIIGDAAHATTPWQAAGCGMSIEDSLVLSTLLGRARSVSDAKTALKVYDQVWRPRTQRIVASSRGTGQIMSGLTEEFGLDFEKLKAGLLPRWDFIVGFDNEKHREEAIQLLEREL